MTTYMRDLVERAVSSFAGAVLAALGAEAVDLLAVDWRGVLGVGLGAAVVSVLKALAARRVGDPGSASLSTKVGSTPR
ncbi:holin [Goodfellowiella coeruleoviolacea]|uniref:Holin, r1t family n=1 Tax=Goodfellowiella coeruleoviolacea TaxID=334858 RepID=A0AAE3KIM4_9PSEU|nr:holin [Goodfellowiella coeruleoviolacea]MCP2168142.1 holin, r1t family [Goodfellowiella coeruleoviolacea]